MPWFITSIHLDKQARVFKSDKRCFGFKNTYLKARLSVNKNEMNMHECMYNYLVMEYIEAGIHPHVHIEEWFEWVDGSVNGWLPCNKPVKFKGIVNWALG